MIFAGLIASALTFTIASYYFKKGVLSFTGASIWLISAIYCFQLSLATWDIYFCLGFLFIMLTVVESFSPLMWGETTPANETPEEPDIAEMRAEMEAFNKERSQYNFLYKNKPKRRARW